MTVAMQHDCGYIESKGTSKSYVAQTYIDLALLSTETFGVTSLDDNQACNQLLTLS